MSLPVFFGEEASIQGFDESNQRGSVGVPHELAETNFSAVEIFVFFHEFFNFLVVFERNMVIDT